MPAFFSFLHPEPVPSPTRVWPVFLPFAGCPYRCVFCAQDKQTGQDEANLEAVFHSLESDLEGALALDRGPYELAFYGGTFTALPSPWPQTFLALAVRFRERGLISRIRCSTRPDCVGEPMLVSLRNQGLDMVELGIQSFDDAALKQSGRGYKGETARHACDVVKASGLTLGVQLLPGLPGDRRNVFAEDTRIAAAMGPETVRLYPCLVIKGTRLAMLWQKGGYEPWSLDRAKAELAEALLVLWDKNVHVIRLGLAPEGSLEDNILAGPWHPALGQSARGLALFELIRRHVVGCGHKPVRLDVPKRYSGEFYGHGRELAPAYFKLGLPEDAVFFTDSHQFILS